jgi:hypothetical protein
MSTTSLSTVFNEIFTTPLNAVCEAEKKYRSIWADWIRFQIPLFKAANGGNLDKASIDKMLDLAPVVKLDGVIEVGITMRIAEVSKKDGSINAGLQLGPVHASGSFGFSKQTSSESLFQASTRFTLSNQQTNLKEYLSDRNIVPTDEITLTEAAQSLEDNA